LEIKGKIVPECWKVFIDIIQRCMDSEAEERPTMGEVEVQLEYALSLQEQADITNIHDDCILLSKPSINLHKKNKKFPSYFNKLIFFLIFLLYIFFYIINRVKYFYFFYR